MQKLKDPDLENCPLDACAVYVSRPQGFSKSRVSGLSAGAGALYFAVGKDVGFLFCSLGV